MLVYGLLENEIIPLYYDKDKKGISKGWCKVIKNSIAQIAPHYTMKRQLDDYYSKFYEKEAKRFKELSKNDNRLAKDIAQWKETVVERWDAINVVSAEWNYPSTGAEAGQKYTLKYVINEQGLDDAIALEKVNVLLDKNGEKATTTPSRQSWLPVSSVSTRVPFVCILRTRTCLTVRTSAT